MAAQQAADTGRNASIPLSDDWHKQSKLELLAEKALVFNKMGMLRIKYPCTADEALYYALGGIMDVVAFSREQNDVLSYVKALLECGEGRASLTIIGKGVPEIIRNESWKGSNKTNSCLIALSALYLSDTIVPVDKLLSSFIA